MLNRKKAIVMHNLKYSVKVLLQVNIIIKPVEDMSIDIDIEVLFFILVDGQQMTTVNV